MIIFKVCGVESTAYELSAVFHFVYAFIFCFDTDTVHIACLTSTSQYLWSCSTVGSGHIMSEPKEVCQQIQMLATRTVSPVSGCVHVVWGEMVMTEMAGTVRASS